MTALELLAERKIADAVSRGELDGLPGQGRPLALDDDPLVPEELRVAYRILKNAGYVPPDLEAPQGAKKLGFLKTRVEARYYGKVIARLASSRTRRSPS
jgi:hypothetical protein